MKEKWEKFLEAFYQVAHHGKKIRGVLERAAQLGEAIELYNSNNGQAHIEGRKNLWILKPGNTLILLITLPLLITLNQNYRRDESGTGHLSLFKLEIDNTSSWS